MERIQSCLWFDRQAEAAATFYTSLFPRSKIGRTVRYGKAAANASGQPQDAVMTVDFELAGLPVLALDGGPHFKLNPSISLFVGCDSEEEIDTLWGKLAKTKRMDLAKYPFAEKYGWCEDRFGVNWQLILAPREQKVTPALLFANQRFGKAEKAIQFYVSQFPDGKIGQIARDEKTNAVLYSEFTLAGQDFHIMEGPGDHQFDFTPAFSFIVPCASQQEIDDVWRKLSAVPDAERCGWLQDPFGVSWQVMHKDWGKMLGEADPAAKERLMGAILKMKKPDLNELERVIHKATSASPSVAGNAGDQPKR